MIRLVPLVLLVLLGAACAASSRQLVPRPSQDVAVTRPELCRIYVFRESQVMGTVRTMRVYDQDIEIGSLAGGEYLCWERPAGHTLLRVLYEGPEIDRGDLEDLYDMQALAGTVCYLSVALRTESERIALGDKRGSPEFHTVGSEEGKKLIEASSPVAVH